LKELQLPGIFIRLPPPARDLNKNIAFSPPA
jgi:hypothetical protein